MITTSTAINVLKKILKWTAIVVGVYITYFIINVLLYFTHFFPGAGTYDFVFGSAEDKSLRRKFIEQMSWQERATTFSTTIHVADPYRTTFNGKELGSCELAGQEGNWYGYIWTASITGEKHYYWFTCKDGFQQRPNSEYNLTLR